MPERYIQQQILAPTGWNSERWSLISAQIRERAFFMAGVEQARLLQTFRDMAAAVASGSMSAPEARIAIRRILKAQGYTPPQDAAGSIHDLTSRRRIDMVVETNVRQARGWAQWSSMLGSYDVVAAKLTRFQRRAVPRNWLARWGEAAETVGWQGVAAGGRMVATLSSPIWRAISRFDLPYPPYDFNSGMWVVAVSRDEAASMGLTPTPADFEEPPSLNEKTEADVGRLDADLIDQLEKLLGGIIEREGSTLRMRDINGTRAYTLQELRRMFAAPLPPGITSLQAKALAAWLEKPDDLLPGHSKAHLLPALQMLSRRCRPQAPDKLLRWLREVDSGA